MTTLLKSEIDDIGFLKVPTGTTAQRPVSPALGYIRFNTSLNQLEFYNGTTWQSDIFKLFDFSTFTFNRAGATNESGPTQSQLLSSYDTNSNPWLSNTDLFTSSSGTQIWTVPKSAWYTIQARGARGGNGSAGSPGDGAIMQGDVFLEIGEKLNIIVGQQPAASSEGGGGGGGSFVWSGDNRPIIVAGGGGGVGDTNAGDPDGVRAVTSTSGTGARATSNGGSNGRGGGGSGAGGGGGFLTNGGNGSVAAGGQSAINGGVGGNSGTNSGGFGGGGGENRSGDNEGGGGGGGYSGGGGGNTSNDDGGGGGGSFLASYILNPATSDGNFNLTNREPHHPLDQNDVFVRNIGSWNTGHGEVIITMIEAT